MAAPTAPMPLRNQVKAGSNIVVTVPLRGLGPAPSFTDGGTTYNSGDPTATYTITIPTPVSSITGVSIYNILDELDNLAGLPNNVVVIT
jgi:hypothetical protein